MYSSCAGNSRHGRARATAANAKPPRRRGVTLSSLDLNAFALGGAMLVGRLYLTERGGLKNLTSQSSVHKMGVEIICIFC